MPCDPHDLPDRNSRAGYLIFFDDQPFVRAANITVALAIVRQKYPNAYIQGATDPIGLKIVDHSGSLAYYLTPEDWDRMKRFWAAELENLHT